EPAVTALPRPVRAPDRSQRVALVRNRQLAAVGRGHPRQRHRQVVTQGQVGLAGPLVLAAAQDLEDELVAFLAVLAHEDIEPLEGRGGERLEPVAGEHRPDERERALPGLELAGKEVTGPRGGIELRWHAPYAPRPGRSPSHRFPAAGHRARPAARLRDRLPARPVLIAAAAVQAVTALVLTQVSGIGPVLALATGFGVGAAVLQPGLGAIVPRLAGPAGPAGQVDRVSRVGLTRA